jgi:hypothetical protein
VIETSGLSKQEKFLELIRNEDNTWADAIKTKIISMNRIYSWDDATIAEIIGMLPDLTLATALRAAPSDFKPRVDKLLTSLRRRKVYDLIDVGNPSVAEVSTTHVKIIGIIRQMVADGTLRFERFDAPLQIEDGIEEILGRTSTGQAPQAASSDFTIEYEHPPEVENTPPPIAEPKENLQQDVFSLKKKIAELSKENLVLRNELASIKTKLSQIKKIA